MESRAIVENVALKGPEAAIVDFATILDVLDASVVRRWFDVGIKVKAKPANEGRKARLPCRSSIARGERSPT